MSVAAAILIADTLHRQQKEEEAMSNYSAPDLHENWEFKIVRTFSTAFKQPAEFRKLLNEEARADWRLVEKLDDSRVRFKRPSEAKSNDGNLPRDVDPYRTIYGTNPATSPLFFLRLMLFILLLATAVLLPVGAFATYMEHRSAEARSQSLAKNMQTISGDISQLNKEILETRIRTLDARLHVLEAK